MQPGLGQVLPIYSLSDEPNGGAGDVEQVGDFLVTKASGRVQGADSENVLVAKNGLMVLRAKYTCTVPKLICLVFNSRGPAKVVRPVIEWASIIMGHFMPKRRLGAMKSRADDGVNQMMGEHTRDLIAKTDSEIRRCAAWARLQQPAVVAHMFSGFGHDNAIKRSHSSEARRLVVRVSWDWTPFLSSCYELLSHVALLQRGGQGVTEGGNQPSFPNCSDTFAMLQGISILAARV